MRARGWKTDPVPSSRFGQLLVNKTKKTDPLTIASSHVRTDGVVYIRWLHQLGKVACFSHLFGKPPQMGTTIADALSI
jgi:hypothetical protein